MTNFQSLLDILTRDHPPRVWSLVVTVFGVLGHEEGTEISGAVLNKIMALAGIKPEATRVALHRLKKDGWLNVRKEGRTSHYRLSASGHAQTTAASPRIFHTHMQPDSAWLVVLPRGAEPDTEELETCVPIGKNSWVTDKRPKCADALCIRISAQQQVPDWVLEKLLDPEIVIQCEDVNDRLTNLEHALNDGVTLTAYEGVVLNALVVHSWRRIVLRLPQLPDYIYAHQPSLIACRTRALQLISVVKLPSLDTLIQD